MLKNQIYYKINKLKMNCTGGVSLNTVARNSKSFMVNSNFCYNIILPIYVFNSAKIN